MRLKEEAERVVIHQHRAAHIPANDAQVLDVVPVLGRHRCAAVQPPGG